MRKENDESCTCHYVNYAELCDEGQYHELEDGSCDAASYNTTQKECRRIGSFKLESKHSKDRGVDWEWCEETT